MSASSSRFLPLIIAALVLVVGVLTWKLLPDRDANEPPGGASLVGGPFSLLDQTGKRVTDQDFRGRYMLVFFGYTFCPDICPMELMSMSAAMDQLPKEVADKVQPIFITVDPARDTVPVMAEFIQNFSPRLIGLTGTEAEIKAATRAYRVYYQKSTDGSDTEYLMDHSAIVFVMGPKGQYVAHFSAGVSADMMAQKLREIVK